MFDQRQNYEPKTNKCCCDCGTRIVIDEQLLEQRQLWKEKYLCLQKQMIKDISQMKQNIYNECSNVMQQQFQQKQKQQAKIVNKKNTEIQQLTSQIISLQTTIKVMKRQKQLEKQKLIEFQQELKQKEQLINMLKTQGIQNQHDWKDKIEDDMKNFRSKLIQQNKDIIQNLETQNVHLKHKLKDFQKKYQILIPEVNRLKSALNEKSSSLSDLQQKYQRLKRQHTKQLNDAVLQKQEIQKNHSSCRTQILKLNEKIAQLEIQIKNQKKSKNQVKVEPIYIEKPVHVQKIVQKIIPVERVIKQYVQPVQYRDQALQHQFSKLRKQNDQIIKENQLLLKKFQQTVKDYEKVIKQFQSNISKYKSERQSLSKKIQQLNKQLDIVYSVKRVQNIQNHLKEPQKVTVYVKNQGISEYYSTGTTIPRIMAVSSPRNLQRSTSRHNSRNKPLSGSQSSKKAYWK